ncbi:MAG: competence/damage-inducible protein A [Rhodospirillaceae bacterium]|nr:competence/damage-inducible protein A [Rhodospirillaceae bacterium]
MSDAPTACVLIIGDEILSGRTQDANLKYFATRFAELGVRLKEARVIPDDADVIVDTLNTMRARYSYVITTGGIGPTHDDITTLCVARAFGRKVIRHEGVAMRMAAYFGDRLNEARLRMAEVPDGPGVSLIESDVTIAPGFRIENVFVLAGVPSIAHAMFESLAPQLKGGAPMLSGNVVAGVREGDIATGLTAIQEKYPGVAIGSYPSMGGATGFRTSVVARGTDRALIDKVLEDVAALMRAQGGDPVSEA